VLAHAYVVDSAGQVEKVQPPLRQPRPEGGPHVDVVTIIVGGNGDSCHAG
jgi:hypothetical protein